MKGLVDMDYFLRSPRLGFRCWNGDDLPLAMELWGDGEVTALIGGPFSPEAVHARLAQEIRQMEGHGLQYWPIFLLADDRHVGCAGLRIYRKEQRVYELGFHLRRDFWGQGLATESARAVIDYGFEKVGAEGLFAGHHPENNSSGRVLLKLGFSFAGEEFYPSTGILEPTYLLRKPRQQAK
jgi:[ribosomal protein S5]-alanine N-acetyltransferase